MEYVFCIREWPLGQVLDYLSLEAGLARGEVIPNIVKKSNLFACSVREGDCLYD